MSGSESLQKARATLIKARAGRHKPAPGSRRPATLKPTAALRFDFGTVEDSMQHGAAWAYLGAIASYGLILTVVAGPLVR